jgi:two-component system sensor histidine kinase YesM
MVSFNLSKIAQICDNVKPYDDSFTYVVGDDGTIVYDSEGTAIGDMMRPDVLGIIRTFNNYATVLIDEKQYVVVSEQSVETGWSIVSLVPVSEYSKDINTITKYIVLIAILATGVSIFFTYLLSKQFSKPIENLSRVMNHIEDGNLDLRAEEKGSDEISLLSRNFNSLIARLKFVMEHEYELTIRQKDAELKALQAQINPHFLFNSLQSVNSIAAVYQISEINTIVDSLGKILRYSIKTKDNIVSMREEVEHATHYLNIYKVRFGERIKYQIQIPDELMQYSILKLSLQPIVENAIIHGFRNAESVWYIMISASVRDDIITIEISDNGIGMSPEELQALQENLDSSDSGFYSSEYPSIGLKNVYHRMKISYGDSAKIEIDSDLNVGTSVKIHYPALLYKEVESHDTNSDR